MYIFVNLIAILLQSTSVYIECLFNEYANMRYGRQ